MAEYNTKGIQYPLTIKNGDLVVVTKADLTRSHIFNVLETIKGERVMNPTFGLPSYIFSLKVDEVVPAIRNQLRVQIPAATFKVEGEYNEDGSLNVEIHWAYNEEPQASIKYNLG